MSPIQVILVGLFLALLVLVLRRGHGWQRRTVQLAIILTGVILVLRPEWASLIAQALGIGRGADLVLYLAVTAGGYAWVILNQRLRKLEAELTEVARAVSIATAKPDEPAETD